MRKCGILTILTVGMGLALLLTRIKSGSSYDIQLPAPCFEFTKEVEIPTSTVPNSGWTHVHYAFPRGGKIHHIICKAYSPIILVTSVREKDVDLEKIRTNFITPCPPPPDNSNMEHKDVDSSGIICMFQCAGFKCSESVIVRHSVDGYMRFEHYSMMLSINVADLVIMKKHGEDENKSGEKTFAAVALALTLTLNILFFVVYTWTVYQLHKEKIDRVVVNMDNLVPVLISGFKVRGPNNRKKYLKRIIHRVATDSSNDDDSNTSE